MELSKKVLMCDEVPLENLPRYEVPNDAVSIIYSPMTGNVVKSSGAEEILIPLTKKDVDWDKVLIQMLEKSARVMTSRETKLGITAKSLDDIDLKLDVDTHFSDLQLICAQVVTHPDNAFESSELDVRETDLCPKDKAYFLPPPQFLGVLATKNFPSEPLQAGMSIVNSQYVLEVELLEK